MKPQVTVLNETILNVFRNHDSSKYITVRDKDPMWINENIKSTIKTRNLSYKYYIDNGKF